MTVSTRHIMFGSHCDSLTEHSHFCSLLLVPKIYLLKTSPPFWRLFIVLLVLVVGEILHCRLRHRATSQGPTERACMRDRAGSHLPLPVPSEVPSRRLYAVSVTDAPFRLRTSVPGIRFLHPSVQFNPVTAL